MPTMLCTRNSVVENTTFTSILSSVIACRARCCLQRCIRQQLVEGHEADFGDTESLPLRVIDDYYNGEIICQ